jgi:uncharacterized protein (DUF3820 family)
MTVRRITIEYEDGTCEVLTPAEWMGIMLGARSGESSALLSDSTTNPTSVDYIQETFQTARNLVSAVEEEEIAVQIDPLPVPSPESAQNSELVSTDAPISVSPIREEIEEPVSRPVDDHDKAYRQATVLRFPFGKYKGRTILELVLDDSEFAHKCLKQLGNNGKHSELANAIKIVLEKNPGI